jgi:hypothetical protein
MRTDVRARGTRRQRYVPSSRLPLRLDKGDLALK